MIWLKWLALIIGVLVAALLIAAAYGKSRWTKSSERLLAKIEAARLPAAISRYDVRELEGLPTPVQRYFRAVLHDGQPIITAVSIEQEGSMNMSETAQRWKPFTAKQRFVTRRPGFLWDAKIMMLPGVPVYVHDAYIAEDGLLNGAVLGLIPVVNVSGTPEMAQGELLRFFAEAAWYPTALLPSQGVQWQPIDDRSASATLSDGNTGVTLTIRFYEDGLIESFYAPARGRMVDGKASSAPWQGRLWNYVLRDGMRVPLEGEAAYLMPEGEQVYWRGKVTSIRFAHE